MDKSASGFEPDSTDVNTDDARCTGGTGERENTDAASSLEASSTSQEVVTDEASAIDASSSSDRQTSSFDPEMLLQAGNGTQSSGDAGNLVMLGYDFESAIHGIMALGYTRDEATVAMVATCNNPHRAVEYLLSCPSRLTVEDLEAAEEDTAASRLPDITENTAADSDDPLIVFASQPQFAEIRHMLNSNPQLLNSFLQQVRRTNPRLHEAIRENRERFLQTLNDPLAPDVGPGVLGGGAAAASGSIVLSQSEHEAVERLMALGFPRSFCVQAYFACEESEELAADFLLSQDDSFYG